MFVYGRARRGPAATETGRGRGDVPEVLTLGSRPLPLSTPTSGRQTRHFVSFFSNTEEVGMNFIWAASAFEGLSQAACARRFAQLTSSYQPSGAEPCAPRYDG